MTKAYFRSGNYAAIVLGVFFLFAAPATGAEPVPEPIDQEFIADVDQTVQKYVVIPPSAKDRPSYDLLIALHGHGSDRWQFATHQRAETRAVRDTAGRHQMILVCPDYRATTSWMGPTAEADLVQLIAILKGRHSIRHVYLCGASMGGSSALTFAVLHPELIDGVVAMNGTANHVEFANFQDAISVSFGGSKQEKPDEYKRRSAELWPERLTMPIGLTTGGQDQAVPPDSVRRLARLLHDQQRPVLHIDRDEGGHSTTYEDATAVLEYMIQPTTQSPTPR
ncbi:prolyl oligopeptidase family serine peptidase [Blastopirellula sp. JC732]|uniref:Prolyl oligopeptidase family serine peptidase n=1 Tax=Blastopirellula sediminis TaxID=2894196 RepID=A0A9X1MJL2_9BACT|nr:alpha/beta fold hydrolase [Blastopirellula sediminis]MCC9608080.1 prolyl oligopeptidase family serine peptidase [Blastopirellula sediminis]MCC9627127.1 prolyl oligopeptidase family serine peptidase [Blastopirellula sediminis]